MAKMRARRAPFTNPRDGRLKKKIRWAFWWSGGKPLTTTEATSEFQLDILNADPISLDHFQKADGSPNDCNQDSAAGKRCMGHFG